MRKIWFIVIDGIKHGPFSVEELRNLPVFNPDTLVWREGFSKPLPARDVPELKSLFEDSEELNPEEEQTDFSKVPSGDELALDMRSMPPSLLFFLFLLIILIISLLLLKH
jgi:hypothetical protein